MSKQARQYWLVKTEPKTYSYGDLERDGQTVWDGVRNYQARNNLQAMRVGDQVLIYHSVSPKEVVGLSEVVRSAYPDPTTDDQRWFAVNLKAVRRLPRPVTLEQIKRDPALRALPLVTQVRLSVMPVPEKMFRRIVELGGSGR